MGFDAIPKITSSSFFIHSSWQAYKGSGDGMLKNRGLHYINLLLYLAGSKQVLLQYRPKVISRLDSIVIVLFEKR
jgi:hypothetical protein